MKKLIIALAIVLGVGILVTAIGLIVHFAGNGDSAQDVLEDKFIAEEQNVTSIEIAMDVGEMELLPSTDGKFSISYVDGKYYKYEYEYKNGKVSFEQFKNKKGNRLSSHNYGEYKVKAYIPANLQGALKLDIVSGKVVDRIEEINVRDFELDVISGSVSLLKINATNEIEIDVTSGSVNVTECNAVKLDIDATSGALAVDKATVAQLNYEATSGTGKIKKLSTNSAKVDIKSGKIELMLVGAPNDYSISSHASTGNIKVIQGTKTLQSGKDYIYGAGAKTITIDIASGGADIIFE